MFSCRSRFFTRRDRRGVSKVFALWEVECVFSRIFTLCACVCACMHTHDSQVQDSMSRSYRVRCRITSRPRKDDCFKKWKIISHKQRVRGGKISFFLPDVRNIFSCRLRFRFFLCLTIPSRADYRNACRVPVLCEVESTFYIYFYIVHITHACTRAHKTFRAVWVVSTIEWWGAKKYRFFIPNVRKYVAVS